MPTTLDKVINAFSRHIKNEINLGLLFADRSFNQELDKVKRQYKDLSSVEKNEYFIDDSSHLISPLYSFSANPDIPSNDIKNRLFTKKIRVAINCGSPTVLALFVYLLKEGFYFKLSAEINRSGDFIDVLKNESFDMINVGYSTLVPISQLQNRLQFRLYFLANKTKCNFFSLENYGG